MSLNLKCAIWQAAGAELEFAQRSNVAHISVVMYMPNTRKTTKLKKKTREKTYFVSLLAMFKLNNNNSSSRLDSHLSPGRIVSYLIECLAHTNELVDLGKLKRSVLFFFCTSGIIGGRVCKIADPTQAKRNLELEIF